MRRYDLIFNICLPYIDFCEKNGLVPGGQKKTAIAETKEKCPFVSNVINTWHMFISTGCHAVIILVMFYINHYFFNNLHFIENGKSRGRLPGGFESPCGGQFIAENFICNIQLPVILCMHMSIHDFFSIFLLQI